MVRLPDTVMSIPAPVPFVSTLEEPVTTRLLKVEPDVPPRCWAEPPPLNVIVPELWIKVPLFVKSRAIFRLALGTVSEPVMITL